MIFISFLIWFDGFCVKKGFRGSFHFVSQVFMNWTNSENAEIKLELTLSDSAFHKLKSDREDAISRGYIELEEDAFVPAFLVYKKKKIKCKVRLKGKMLDHVQGDKWSFRVKIEKDDALLGMRKFSLQHPGTRNYIYDWIYHKWSGKEGIIKLNYLFVNLILNGENLGIYALEENFAQELLVNNKKKKGPIFRFDPSAFWDFRLHEMKGLALNDEHAKFISSRVDAFNESSTAADPELNSLLNAAILSLRNFISGKVNASQVLDIKKFAIRHALLDIIGGQHSVDWSDVKFYYNPETFLIEPIAYESFSANKINSLIGEYRAKSDPKEFTDFHDNLFSDPEFFKEYVRQLNRMSAISYQDSIFNLMNEPLQKSLSVLHSEFPYKNFDRSIYRHNVKVIQEILASKKIIHANSIKFSKNKLEFKIANVSSLPIEIIGVKINNKMYSFDSSTFVFAKSRNALPSYISVHWKIENDFIFNQKDELKVIYRIAGNSIQQAEIIHKEEILADNEIQNNYLIHAEEAAESGLFLVDHENKVFCAKHRDFVIDHPIRFLPGYKLLVLAGTKIQFKNSGLLIINGDLNLLGSENAPIEFNISDSIRSGILVRNSSNSVFEYVIFNGSSYPKSGSYSHPAFFNFFNSKVEISRCIFTNAASPILSLNESISEFENCLVEEFKNTFLISYFSKLYFTTCSFQKSSGEDFIFSSTSNVWIKDCFANNINSTFIKAKQDGEMVINGLKYNSGKKVFELKDGVKLRVYDSEFSNFKKVISMNRKNEIFDFPQAYFFNSKFPIEKKYFTLEKGSVLASDGKIIDVGYE